MTMFADVTMIAAKASETATADQVETDAYRRDLAQAQNDMTEAMPKVLGNRHLARFLGVDQRIRRAIKSDC